MVINSFNRRVYPPNFLESYKRKLVSADEAVKNIKSGDKILIHSNCAFPSALVEALVSRKDELRDVEIMHALAVGDIPYLQKGLENSFRHNAFFLGASSRKAVNEGRADFSPIHLSEIPLLFKKGIIKVDVALLQVSPPDEHGFCSLGLEVGLSKTGAEKAKMIIAQVNNKVPRVLGDSFIHISKISYFVESDEPLKELPQSDHTDPKLVQIYEKIGENVASLIEDGATLQLGIGAIPDSVLHYLTDRKDLGIHSEMFSDGVVHLIEKGIITNERKTLHQGKAVAGFVLGSNYLYQYINNNPLFEFHPQEYVNDPFIIAKNCKMTAINSAIEVDITGQVCADSIGSKIFSGFGGQVDFIRGAARSEGGKPIIALPSTTKDGKLSRIVSMLKQGAGVVTTRGDVHYVVTEYGVADLHGKTLRQRIRSLVDIAHPDFRDELSNYAITNNYLW
jgi:4-hydroxybutyrate CoA-transferase